MKFRDLFRMAAVAALAVSLGASPAMAKGGGNGKAKAPVVKAKAPKAPSGSAAAGAKAKSPAPKAKASAPKTKTSGSASAKSGGSAKSTQSNKGTEPKPTLSASDPAAGTSPTDPTLPLSKAQEKLLKNANLQAKMQARLPLGTDVMVAASGFRNLGQFVAAVNVSNNLGIEFKLLKDLMVGVEQLSLGQAIQQAKAMDAGTATTVATTALSQADAEIAASPSTSVSTKKGKPRN